MEQHQLIHVSPKKVYVGYIVTNGGVKLKWSILGVSEFTNAIIVCIAVGTVDEELPFQTKYIYITIDNLIQVYTQHIAHRMYSYSNYYN